MTVISPTPTAAQQRVTFFTAAALMIPLGLLARSFRAGADPATPTGFVTTYLGDTVWAVMFFFLFAGCLVRWRTHRLAVLTLGVTLAIEFSQRYHVEPLATLRSFAPTRFLHGTHFLWSDVACLLVGTFIAATLHYGWTAAHADPDAQDGP